MSKTKKASEEFVKGKHNIGYVSDSFLDEFKNDKILPGKVLSSHKLTRSMTDFEIKKEFGIEECALGDVLATLDAATDDMKDGNYNIFFIKDRSRVVLVLWCGGGWFVFDWYRGGGWGAGGRVFSPATSDSKKLRPGSSESLTLDRAIEIVKKEGYKIYKEI